MSESYEKLCSKSDNKFFDEYKKLCGKYGRTINTCILCDLVVISREIHPVAFDRCDCSI